MSLGAGRFGFRGWLLAIGFCCGFLFFASDFGGPFAVFAGLDRGKMFCFFLFLKDLPSPFFGVFVVAEIASQEF